MSQQTSSPIEAAWADLEGPHAKMNLLFNALEACEDRESALVALDRLGDELEKHFALEERDGGLYASIGTETKGAAAVLSDHDKLRGVIESTRKILEKHETATASASREATIALGTELRGHEKRERALVRRILSERG